MALSALNLLSIAVEQCVLDWCSLGQLGGQEGWWGERLGLAVWWSPSPRQRDGHTGPDRRKRRNQTAGCVSHDRLRRQLTAHGPKEGLCLNAMHINIAEYTRWMLAMTARLLVWLLLMQWLNFCQSIPLQMSRGFWPDVYQSHAEEVL